MEKLIAFLHRKATAAAMTVAAVIIVLQIILPTFFDVVTGMLLMGIMWIATRRRRP